MSDDEDVKSRFCAGLRPAVLQFRDGPMRKWPLQSRDRQELSCHGNVHFIGIGYAYVGAERHQSDFVDTRCVELTSDFEHSGRVEHPCPVYFIRRFDLREQARHRGIANGNARRYAGSNQRAGSKPSRREQGCRPYDDDRSHDRRVDLQWWDLRSRDQLDAGFHGKGCHVDAGLVGPRDLRVA